MPIEGAIVGRGLIVCENKHVTKAYHLAVGVKGSSLEIVVFLSKDELEKAINESGSEKLKALYEALKKVYGL